VWLPRLNSKFKLPLFNLLLGGLLIAIFFLGFFSSLLSLSSVFIVKKSDKSY
jgi:amino acid transporter